MSEKKRFSWILCSAWGVLYLVLRSIGHATAKSFASLRCKPYKSIGRIVFFGSCKHHSIGIAAWIRLLCCIDVRGSPSGYPQIRDIRSSSPIFWQGWGSDKTSTPPNLANSGHIHGNLDVASAAGHHAFGDLLASSKTRPRISLQSARVMGLNGWNYISPSTRIAGTELGISWMVLERIP